MQGWQQAPGASIGAGGGNLGGVRQGSFVVEPALTTRSASPPPPAPVLPTDLVPAFMGDRLGPPRSAGSARGALQAAASPAAQQAPVPALAPPQLRSDSREQQLIEGDLMDIMDSTPQLRVQLEQVAAQLLVLPVLGERGDVGRAQGLTPVVSSSPAVSPSLSAHPPQLGHEGLASDYAPCEVPAPPVVGPPPVEGPDTAYEVPSTGARLTHDNAAQLLNSYVSRLPGDRSAGAPPCRAAGWQPPWGLGPPPSCLHLGMASRRGLPSPPVASSASAH